MAYGNLSNRMYIETLPTAWNSDRRAVPLAWGGTVNSTLLAGFVVCVTTWNYHYQTEELSNATLWSARHRRCRWACRSR